MAGSATTERESEEGHRRYGTFEGVFVPTLLTIIGVILFLRQGWVVGNAGLVGALLIIALAFLITGATGLCIASIATDTRIGAGGAYAVITRSLGQAAGGSIGIPLYLAQSLVVALYVFGFRDGWLLIFPDHPPLVIDLLVFAVIFAAANYSTKLAFRIQYVILAIVIGALASIAAAAIGGSMTEPIEAFGDYPGDPDKGFPGTSFFAVFAVFFPAATGIMAGVNISGELKDPNRAIPLGTMGAIAISLVVYAAVAYWLDRSASPDLLAADYEAMFELAAFKPAIIAGVLAATFSSALASVVGAPRILQAIAVERVIPGLGVLAKRDSEGEPKNAMFVTGAVVLGALALRELNLIAAILTMFFLVTYLMVNLVVLFEQGLGLVSFRPTIKLPIAVPLVGAIGSIFAMLVVNWVSALLALAVVGAVYAGLARRELHSRQGDIRSGLFYGLANWSARRVIAYKGTTGKAWTPSLLVPVDSSGIIPGGTSLLHAIAEPSGTVQLVGISGDPDQMAPMADLLRGAAHELRGDGVGAQWATLEEPDFEAGSAAAIQILRGTFFKPNTLLYRLPPEPDDDAAALELMRRAGGSGLGTLLLAAGKGSVLRPSTLNLWLGSKEPDWSFEEDSLSETDLALLVCVQMSRTWDLDINLVSVVHDDAKLAVAGDYLAEVSDRARLPKCQARAIPDRGPHTYSALPAADINIFGLSPEPNLDLARQVAEYTESLCLFARDSGKESALA